MNLIKTDKFTIGEGCRCFIVAEAGINHNGDIKLAKEMVDAAKQAGADAIKFQKFKAEEFISDPKETYTYRSGGRGITESMLEMFKRYEFEPAQWIEIFEYCRKKRIVFFATAQNPPDLDFLLENTDMPLIKVGSDDLTNLELLSYCASKGKPVIISAGMAYLTEVEDAVNVIRQQQDNIAVLHCVANYPAEPEDLNLQKMITIRDTFKVVTGFSDHSIGSVAATAAAALGASIIEKHFTLDKNLQGPDHWFSADTVEFNNLVKSVRYVEQAIGSGVVEPVKKELKMRKIARRSIVAAKDLPAGRKIAKADIVFKRPGTGLEPKLKNSLVGKVTKQSITKNTIITLDMVQ